MVATRTQTILPAPITQTALGDAIKQKFIDIGYTLLDDYITGTDRFLIYSYQFDATKTFGTVFFRFKITSALSMTQVIGTAYTPATKTLSNPGTESFASSFQSNVNADVLTYVNANQYRLVYVAQGLTSLYTFILGFIRPTNKPGWWEENNAPYAFVCRNTDPYISPLYPAGLRPFSSLADVAPPLFPTLLAVNPLTVNRDIISGIPLLATNNSGNTGFVGTMPEDICPFAGNGTAKLDTIIAGNEKYDILFPSATNASGYCIRIM